MRMHPPVLLIPEAFSQEDCAKLIEIFHTRGQNFVNPNQPALDYFGADYKMRIPEQMREDRIDHFFHDKATVAFLVNWLTAADPEIAKGLPLSH